MVTMPDGTSTAKQPIEGAQKKTLTAESAPASPETSLAEVKKPRAGLLKNLGKLKPLLPILYGGLRMVDHGAVQILAQLVNLASGTTPAQSAAQEELHQELVEIETGHRELHLQIQDQTVEMQRIKDQVTLLRQTVERNATEHTELVDNVKSLRNLLRVMGAGLAILLAVLITLTALLLTRHH